MQLTEPQAGSDVGALRTKAERAADGTYRITGQKIFITYGEHDLTDNIIHFVLARLPDAPAGTKGISLFLVPKFLPRGGHAQRCARAFDRAQDGHPRLADLHHGLWRQGRRDRLAGRRREQRHAGMFTMMNQARLAVGLQGVAIAERATQQALAYARERKQGARGTIINHPDVKRMLLTMRALTGAARAICYATAVAIDRSERSKTDAERKAAHERASLLTPVAKAFSTDIGVEVSSLGVQVHGGMGYIEETGAAQHFRDARIAAIYEGTNGIQAIDLVTRKLPMNGGETVEAYIGELREHRRQREGRQRSGASAQPARGWRRAVDSLERATEWLLKQQDRRQRLWPARRRICGCSATPPVAACSPMMHSPRCAPVTARVVRRLRVSSRRTSWFRRTDSSARQITKA